MPLRSLLFFVLACTDDPYDFSGGSGDGQDDSGGESDADTDADSDSDTDTDPIDFEYDELTDVIPYNSPTTVLATNATLNSLDVIDLASRMTTQRVALDDRPSRVRWDPATNLAYVVYETVPGLDENYVKCKSDEDCDNRLDIVDLTAKSVDTIMLTVGKTRYAGTDVALGRDGGVFVLADGADEWWSEESVLEIDAKGAIAAVWPLEEDSEVNAFPLWYDGTSIYAEQWRFTFGTDPKKKTPLLVIANDYSPDDYSDWNGTPIHTALASDRSGILYPGEYNGKTQTVVELDPTKDVVLHEYALDEDVWNDAADMAYTHDETHVVTVGADSNGHRLQVFDRATGKETDSINLGGPGSSETEILVLGNDDAYAWLYVFDSFTDAKKGRFLVASLGL